MRKIFFFSLIVSSIFLTSCHHHCGHHGHSCIGNHSEGPDLSPWLTFFAALIVAFVAGLFTLRQVKLNNISKARLDQLVRLKAYFASFLLRYNQNDDNGKNEVKQNLCSILINLDENSTEHKELYNLTKEYLEHVKMNNPPDGQKVEAIIDEAKRVFSKEWSKIEKSL